MEFNERMNEFLSGLEASSCGLFGRSPSSPPPPSWPRLGGAVVGEDGVLGVVEAGSVVLADGEAKFSALCKANKFLHDIDFTYFVTCAHSWGFLL